MKVAPHESYRFHAECNDNNGAIFSRQHSEMCHHQLDLCLHCPLSIEPNTFDILHVPFAFVCKMENLVKEKMKL